MLAGFLLTWTLAAFGEEVVYQGSLVGVVVAVSVSSVLFGVAHAEQGTIGVITLLDALFSAFCGFATATCGRRCWPTASATPSGLITFFLIGPIYGFWQAGRSSLCWSGRHSPAPTPRWWLPRDGRDVRPWRPARPGATLKLAGTPQPRRLPWLARSAR